tara:strand:- start:515 stop:736 length:222 start_codon:yes stop_codon:yes gene_type:complete
MKGCVNMGAVKNYLWDQAEDFLDDLVSKIKKGMRVPEAMKLVNKADIAFDLIGFNDTDEVEDYLSDIDYEYNC